MQHSTGSRHDPESRSGQYRERESSDRSQPGDVENQKVLISAIPISTLRFPVRTGTLAFEPGNVVSPTDGARDDQSGFARLVTFALPEANLATCGKMPAANSGDSVRGRRRREGNGTLAFFENSVDPTTGTIRLKATFPNTDHALWPGQFVRVTLQLGLHPNAILVPNQAVQSGQDGTFVYTVQPDQRVEVRPVQIAQRVGDETVVTSGVQPGDTVVTEGTLRLVPGARIQVREQTALPRAAVTGEGEAKADPVVAAERALRAPAVPMADRVVRVAAVDSVQPARAKATPFRATTVVAQATPEYGNRRS